MHRVHQVRSCGLRDFLACHPRQTSYRHVHGGTPLHILGTQDVKSSRCTLAARRLEDILRLRHRGCGTLTSGGCASTTPTSTSTAPRDPFGLPRIDQVIDSTACCDLL
jgi:hypothetical protein